MMLMWERHGYKEAGGIGVCYQAMSAVVGVRKKTKIAHITKIAL